MGILRLSQDLLAYAERVVFDASVQTTSHPGAIKYLIVDGPALVHHVYKKLLVYKNSNSPVPSSLPPTYDDINLGTTRILADLEASGPSIKHIFFDGSMPLSKGVVRLRRMEKLRLDLDVHRKLRTEPFDNEHGSTSMGDLDAALWALRRTSPQQLLWAPPPFMVASVIETLCATQSPWKTRVQVVPAEADVYCALAARQSTEVVAIVTNDSDLAVHDLGDNGQVMLIHSMEKHRPTPGSISSTLSALCLNPRTTAVRLGLPSLLNLALERFISPHESLASIQIRASDQSRLKGLLTGYPAFAEEFVALQPDLALHSSSLEGIDPRTSDIVACTRVGGEAPRMYLPPLLEDPQRDSAWSYGGWIRRLAYTLLLTFDAQKGAFTYGLAPTVTEYARKGPRIAGSTIHPIRRFEFITQATELEALFSIYLQRDGSSSQTGPDVVLKWHALALHIVNGSRTSFGKPPPPFSQVSALFGLGALASSAQRRYRLDPISWTDVHLLANLHAVLYSLRMLWQLLGYTLKLAKPPSNHAQSMQSAQEHRFQDDNELSKIVRSLHNSLSAMPTIQELFLDAQKLRESTVALDEDNVKTVENLLMTALGLEEWPQDKAGKSHHSSERVHGAKTKQKTRREQERPLKAPPISGHNTNMFALLQDKAG
jgi:hypothetical protein